MEYVQIIFLGQQKLPEYYWNNTAEEMRHEREFIRWYHIVRNGSYQAGDGFIASNNVQSAFGCPRNLEVYSCHCFYNDGAGHYYDDNSISIEEYLEDDCLNLTEIYEY